MRMRTLARGCGPGRRGGDGGVQRAAGRTRIGVWGGGVPVPGEAVYSVLQNLWPLVMNEKPTAETARWWRWGGTVGHAAYVARSAVGQTASGDLMYAASMSTVPADLAGWTRDFIAVLAPARS